MVTQTSEELWVWESRGRRLRVSSFRILQGQEHRELQAVGTQEGQGGREELVGEVCCRLRLSWTLWSHPCGPVVSEMFCCVLRDDLFSLLSVQLPKIWQGAPSDLECLHSTMQERFGCG